MSNILSKISATLFVLSAVLPLRRAAHAQPQYNNVADMLSAVGTNYNTIRRANTLRTLGYNVPGDAGDLIDWRWDSTNTLPTNRHRLGLAGVSTGRFVRQWSGLLLEESLNAAPSVATNQAGLYLAPNGTNQALFVRWSDGYSNEIASQVWNGDVRVFGNTPEQVLSHTGTATTSLIVDALTHPSTYNHDSGFGYFDGYWWLGWNGSDSRYGTIAAEGLSGQEIYLLKGTNWNAYGVASNAYFAPWTSSTYANNPLSVDANRIEWHPNFFVMSNVLWCTWYTTDAGQVSNHLHGAWASTLSSASGKWNIHKASFATDGTATWRTTSLETHNATDAIVINGTNHWPAFTVQPYVDGDYVVQTFSAIPLAYAGNFVVGCIWTTNRGATWEWSVVPQTVGGPSSLGWEPWVVKALDGRWVMVFRSFDTALGQTYGVTYSGDLRSWTTPVWSSIEALPQRGQSMKLSPGLWGLILGDRQYPNPAVLGANSYVGLRQNMALWLSVDGLSWAPGVSLSSGGERADYGAMFEKDGYLYYSYSARDPRGIAVGRIQKPQGVVPWVAPRAAADHTMEMLPIDAGDYLDFSPQARLESTTQATNTGTGYSLAWFGKPYDITCAIMDWRSSGAVGPLLYSDGNVTFNGVFIAPPVSDIVRTWDGWMYLGLSIDETNDTVSSHIRSSGNSWSNKTLYVKRVKGTALPADSETITLNGNTYTFKTSAGAAPEVAIGTNIYTTLLNLKTVVDAYDAAISVPVVPLPTASPVTDNDYSIWLFKSSAHGTSTELAGKMEIPAATFPAITNTLFLGPYNRANTSAQMFRGKVYDAAFFGYGLSDDDHQSLFNAFSATHGLDTETTASSLAWSGAQLRLNPASYSSSTWKSLPAYRHTATWSSGDLVVRGDGGASVATPSGNWGFHTQWKATNPTNRIVLAEVGSLSNRVTVVATNDSGWKVRIEGETNVIQAVASPTDWNNLSITWANGRVYVGGAVAKRYVSSKLYLGRGYFISTTAGRSSDETTTFRISKASVTRFQGDPPNFIDLDSGIPMSGISDYPVEEFHISGPQPKLKLTDTSTASNFWMTVSQSGTWYWNDTGLLDTTNSPMYMVGATPELALKGTTPTVTLQGKTGAILSLQNTDGGATNATTDSGDTLGAIYASGVVDGVVQGAKVEFRPVATGNWNSTNTGAGLEIYATHTLTNGRVIVFKLVPTTSTNRTPLFLPVGTSATPRQIGITNNGTVDLLYLLP